MTASFSFTSTRGKCNSKVNLFTSCGRVFDSTIKFNASVGEEYCEWFTWGTEVSFDINQVGFAPSSLFCWGQQAAVSIYSESGEAFLLNISSRAGGLYRAIARNHSILPLVFTNTPEYHMQLTEHVSDLTCDKFWLFLTIVKKRLLSC